MCFARRFFASRGICVAIQRMILHMGNDFCTMENNCCTIGKHVVTTHVVDDHASCPWLIVPPRLTYRDCEPNVCHNPMPCTAVRWQAEALPVGVAPGQERAWAARQQQGIDMLLVGILRVEPCAPGSLPLTVIYTTAACWCTVSQRATPTGSLYATQTQGIF